MMFGSLTDKFGDIFDRLRGRGALSADDVTAAMREIRIALLEADVALPVVKDFIAKATERAIGKEVLASVTPGQQVVKIVHDTLVESLGSDFVPLAVTAAPTVYLLVGLQGSGKTTTTGKLAKRLKETDRKKVLMASLDVQRPAAQEQLAQLGKQVNVDTLEIIAGQKPLEITSRAIKEARQGGYDVLLLDSAGRLSIDEELMAEIADVKAAANPAETLLVADSMTGQDAVVTAKNFNESIGLTGIILTRIDGDARGGAALSMRQITGQPIRFLGTGEKMDALEPYHPDRLASRILDMGDVVSLVERAAEAINQEDAADMAAKMQKGSFDLEDYIKQLDQMNKMGGMGGIMGMLPGMGKIKKAIEGHNLEDTVFKKHRAMVFSMTPRERRNPKLLNASRKQRISKGSGTSAQELNKLLKQHLQMQDMMKQFQKLGKKGLLRSGMGALMGGR
jgi:signal recognition particle subunit SRP54